MIPSVNITTTNNFGENKIKEYSGLVSSKIVVGANFFADFFASFTDVFGGRSGKYQSRLDEIYNDAIKELTKQAIRRGANGIVGLKMDFDEISGKDKSMFMLNAIGTAVKVDFKSNNDFESIENKMVSKETLANDIKCHAIKKKVLSGGEIFKKDFIAIAGNTEIAETLIKNGLETGTIEFMEEIIMNFIKSLEYSFACDILYKLLTTNKSKEETIISLIKKCYLFNATKIIDIMEAGDIELASKILDCDKDSYTKEDLVNIYKLLYHYNNLPDVCTYETVSSGLFKKTEEKVWVCKNGHKVPLEQNTCLSCSLNKKGINESVVKEFHKFEIKANILEGLLSD